MKNKIEIGPHLPDFFFTWAIVLLPLGLVMGSGFGSFLLSGFISGAIAALYKKNAKPKLDSLDADLIRVKKIALRGDIDEYEEAIARLSPELLDKLLDTF
jgi:hypothetical protein